MIGLLSRTVLNLLPGFIRSSPFDFFCSRVVYLPPPPPPPPPPSPSPYCCRTTNRCIDSSHLAQETSGRAAGRFVWRPGSYFFTFKSVGVSLRAPMHTPRATSATLGFHSPFVFPLRFSMLSPAGRFRALRFPNPFLVTLFSLSPPPPLLLI